MRAGSRRGGGRSTPAGTGAYSLDRTVGKQARVKDRVYPRDMHAILQGRWDSSPLFDGFPRVELPPKAVLGELLDVCFQASMLSERVGCGLEAYRYAHQCFTAADRIAPSFR